MDSLRIMTASEQVAEHLRNQMLLGRWSGDMLGAPSMAVELGVDHRTVISAYGILEKQGLLASQGKGKRRKVILPDDFAPPALRVKILHYENSDKQEFCFVDLLHRLHDMGHVVSFAPKSLSELGMELSRVKRMVENTEADAWVVLSASVDVLEWFAKQPKHAFAMAGRSRGISIAAVTPDKVPALKQSLRHLVSLGHKKIVMLVKEERRKPNPGRLEEAFLDELKTLGLPVGDYNLPDWKPSAEDFHRCLDSLFQHTPPTAVLTDEMSLFIAAHQHLAQKGVLSPRDVSLICMDPHSAFAWCKPTVAHINWEPEPMVRRITEWANHVARGIEDRRQTFTKAEFMVGETIGPVPLR